MAKDNIGLITDAEAAATVQAQEVAKELAKDDREAALLSADILETAVADLGHKKVIFNRVKAPSRADSASGENTTKLSDESAALPKDGFFVSDEHEQISVTFSGTVYDGKVSELWWNSPDGKRFRVFVNADYRYFGGIGDFADDETRYSLFMLIVGQSTEGAPPPEEWRPTLADFTPGVLEYYIMDWGNGDEPDLDDFKVIDATLGYYAEHSETMRIRFENGQKIAAARRAYLEANPPKERDVIVNYRPIETE